MNFLTFFNSLPESMKKLGSWMATILAIVVATYLTTRFGMPVPVIPVPPPPTIERYYLFGAEDSAQAEDLKKSIEAVPEGDGAFKLIAATAERDVAPIADVAAWHASHDDEAVQGLTRHKTLLERRTSRIRDVGVREAGFRLLGALSEIRGPDGRKTYTIDKAAVAAIDPEKLKRWASIALTVLTIVEPFVPPPYNLAVHAAIMLLKLYLAQDQPAPTLFVSARDAERGTREVLIQRLEGDRACFRIDAWPRAGPVPQPMPASHALAW